LGPLVGYFTRPVRIFRDYDRANLRPDAIAGLTVGVIVLPLALAFSVIAELPPEMGLYAAVIGGLVGALWGSSLQVVTGPSNAISLLVLSTLTATVTPGSPAYIVAAGMLAVLAGAFQLLLAVARLGVLINFVSHSVIVGFASGAGVLIAINQLAPLLGISLQADSTIDRLIGVVRGLPSTNLATATIGIGTIVFLWLMNRFKPSWPAALLAMGLTSLAVFALGLEDKGVAVIGALPRGLPPLADLPLLDIDLWRTMAVGAVAVGAIGLVQTSAVSKSIAAQTGQRLDNNQEFLGQGASNILCGLFSGYPVAGTFSNSAVNFRAGARSPIAAVVASLFVLVAMYLLGPFAHYLPRSALAGVLIVTAYRMIDRAEIRRILRGGRGDAVIMVVTFLGTLLLHLETAVFIGILLSFARYIVRTSNPTVRAVVPDKEFRHFVSDSSRDECPQLAVVEIYGDLYFGAVNHIEDFILERAAQQPRQRFLLLRMHYVNNCDFSGIHMLESVVRKYRDRGGDVFLTRVNEQVMLPMQRTGFDRYLGLDHIVDDDLIVAHLFYHVLDPAVCIYECPVRAFRECQNLPKRLDLIDFSRRRSLSTFKPEVVESRELWNAIRQRNGDEHVQIIDVREPSEYRRGHIPDARSVPLTSLSEVIGQLPLSDRFVLVCRSGRRSKLAAQMLVEQGLEDVSILDGGMLAWEAAGLLEAVETFTSNGER
jgi:SulP family sulfate permease